MKNPAINCIVLLLICSSKLICVAQNTWSSINSVTTGRYGGVCFPANGKIYFGTGKISSTTATNDFWELDPTTGVWTQLANAGTSSRYDAIGFAINYADSTTNNFGGSDFITIGGGRDASGTVLSSYYTYVSSTNKWNSATVSLGARYGSVVALVTEYGKHPINSPHAEYRKAYVGGGRNSIGTLLADFYEISTSSSAGNLSITSKASFPGTSREFASGFCVDGSCYIGTGKDSGGNDLKDFWQYNPKTDQWIQKNDFTGGIRSGVTGFNIGSTGYVFGGSGLIDLYSYDNSSDTWTLKQSLSGGTRYFAKGAAVNGMGFIGTGYDGSTTFYNDFYRYTPDKSITIPSTQFLSYYCLNAQFYVIYNSGGLVFNSGNVFTVEMSDNLGSFSSPTTIGTLTGTSTSGSINCSISSGITDGAYKIRVKSSNPSFVGTPIAITFYNTQTPTIAISSDKGTTICQSQSVLFSASITNGGSNPVYVWKKNGNIVGSNSSTYSDSALINSDVITCQLTSSWPCVTSSNASSNSITMTVNSTVAPSVSISADVGNTVCSGTSVTFTATPTNGGGSPSYQWKKNGGNVGTNSNTYSNSSLANSDLITCVLTSNANCASPTTATSNSITMTVTSVTPSVIISASPGNSICVSTSVTFTATPTNGGSSPSYQWKKNGGNVGTNSSTYSSSSLANSDVITCVLTSNATCASPTTATGNSITMTVNSPVTSSVSISSSAGNTICSGAIVSFTATPTNGGTTPSYQWKVNGGNVGINSSSYSTSTLVNGDVVTCILTSNANCASPTTTTPSNTIALTVNANPEKPVILVNGYNLTCSTSEIFYQWYLDGNEIAGANAQDITSNKSGNYSVKTGNSSGCYSISNVLNLVVTGIESLSNISVHPNPFDRFLVISNSSNFSISYLIVDAVGKTIKQETSSENEITIDLNTASCGLHFVLLFRDGSFIGSSKVLKR